jgi:REP element-mobilizing transposase RayT
VTWHRLCLFGEVVDGEMRLNIISSIAKDEWFQTANLRPSVCLYLDEMVVMPNHIHGIIRIEEPNISRGAATLCPYKPNGNPSANVSPNSLGAIIRAYKSAVTYHINTLRKSRGLHVWQRNYYEHIIRNQSELEDYAKYIHANPEHWTDDPE